MRHQKTRKKLSRDSAHRKSLLMNLSKELIEHERIKTTEAKAKAEKLVGNLLKAYEADIKTLPWMSEATRQKALDKLAAHLEEQVDR